MPPQRNARLLLATLACIFAFVVNDRIPSCAAQECSAKDPSVCDTHERCPVWKSEGECLRNRKYMKEYCPVSCADELKASSSTVEDSDCQDKHPSCQEWAQQGECDSNGDMHIFCRKSCNVCESSCRDNHPSCSGWRASGECEANPRWMNENCAKSCGKCVVEEKKTDETAAETYAETEKFGMLQIADGSTIEEVAKQIRKSITYMKTVDMDDTTRARCKNEHALCSFWATVGECDSNERWMQKNCGPACRSCHMVTDWDAL